MKLLLHACCAPCSIQCVEVLAAEDMQPDLFWYNPNIHPYTEYSSRRDSLCLFAKEKNLPLIIPKNFTRRRKGAKGDPELTEYDLALASWRLGVSSNGRCSSCYKIRLEKTAKFAAENGYDAFSTTLLISPYQNHGQIRQTGAELAAIYGVEFLYRDFRPRFREGQKEARKAGFYMQKYCGCIYSEEERYLSKQAGMNSR